MTKKNKTSSAFSKPWLVIVAVVLVLLGVLGFLMIDDQEVSSDLARSRSTEQVLVDSQIPEVTQDQLQAGITAKQNDFDANDPEYPDDGRTAYEIIDHVPNPEFHPTDAMLWRMLDDLAPTKMVLESITEFIVYFDEEDDTLASVLSIDDSNSEWSYEINYVSVQEFQDLIPTLLHEYAHILSLQDAQTIVESEQSDILNTCPDLLVAEGCLEKTAYLNLFFEEFWRGNPDDIGDNERSLDESEALYELKPDDYVSSYAATNFSEDFAESFSTFVMQDLPQADAVKDEKVLFFMQFDELVSYRKAVRSTIANWAQ